MKVKIISGDKYFKKDLQKNMNKFMKKKKVKNVKILKNNEGEVTKIFIFYKD